MFKDLTCFPQLNVFLAQYLNCDALGIPAFFLSLSLSFVWAFLPFKFAMSMHPALHEMTTASAICKKELLCDGKQGEEQDGRVESAETCLRSMLQHVAAAGITAGRCVEIYGLVVPVRALQVAFPLQLVILFFETCADQCRLRPCHRRNEFELVARSLHRKRALKHGFICAFFQLRSQNEVGSGLLVAAYFWTFMRFVSFILQFQE